MTKLHHPTLQLTYISFGDLEDILLYLIILMKILSAKKSMGLHRTDFNVHNTHVFA